MRLAVVITWREESLHSVLEFLKEKDLTVGTLVADRHHQITEWIEEEPRAPPCVKHYFDIWHVAKGQCRCPHASIDH